MIFYFSGSGNSHYAANTIAKKLDIPLVSMTACLKSSKLDFDARKEKYCGFVFPVHFWGVPYLVTKFIRNIQIKLSSDTYVFAVYTCGGGAGNTSKMIEKFMVDKLQKRMKEGRLSFVLNTPTLGKNSQTSGFQIRTIAEMYGIPCFTSIDTARAYLTAVKTYDKGTRLSSETITKYRKKKFLGIF